MLGRYLVGMLAPATAAADPERTDGAGVNGDTGPPTTVALATGELGSEGVDLP